MNNAIDFENVGPLTHAKGRVGKTWWNINAMLHAVERGEKVLYVAKEASFKIIRRHKGFIVLAQNEQDFKNKCNRINRGDTKGFYPAI